MSKSAGGGAAPAASAAGNDAAEVAAPFSASNASSDPVVPARGRKRAMLYVVMVADAP